MFSSIQSMFSTPPSTIRVRSISAMTSAKTSVTDSNGGISWGPQVTRYSGRRSNRFPPSPPAALSASHDWRGWRWVRTSLNRAGPSDSSWS